MVKHLAAKEKDRVRKLAGQRTTGAEVARIMACEREARGETPLHASVIYRFLEGTTHKAGVTDNRGRAKRLSRQDIRKLQNARRL